ncbi:MAG: hypothetical protein K2X47_01570 [Bdellovibrionales bacterium]|nr:hypothetical protein [Bdellovibrionales bacterium]
MSKIKKSSRRHKKKGRYRKTFDKFDFYERSVQSPEVEMEMMVEFYEKLRNGSHPFMMREDFCGTFANSRAWVKQGAHYQAWCFDLDAEPLKWGLRRTEALLTLDEQARIYPAKKNVLTGTSLRTDLILALNFSYFIFRERKVLLSYFKKCLSRLKKNGVLILDCFGGSEALLTKSYRNKRARWWYHWDHCYYNPINHHSKYQIHFEEVEGPFRRSVFRYEWRHWMLPELRDLLSEAGFKKTVVMWEGDDGKGRGDVKFKPRERGDACASWVAYLCALK